MNFFSDEIRRNPHPVYDQMRSSSPVLHVPPLNLWMIFDYEGVKRALNDHDAFSSSMATANRRNPEWFIFFDPPRHTKLRAIVMRAFTPGVVANLEPLVRELSCELLDQTIERGEMDLAADFSIPLPMMVIAGMLGIPVADRSRLKHWGDMVLRLSYTIPGGEEGLKASEQYRAVTVEMNEYLTSFLEERRAEPRDDLLTRLVAAEVDGERLSEKEILGFFQLLLVAGTETTTNLINNALLCLVENPEQFARLRAAPNLVASTIEEVLRYHTPVQWVFRGTRRDVEMHGQVIPAGRFVLPMIGSANRDPKQFREPGNFDILRDPNPHIAFGHGIHFCLGAALSRLEARIALADLLERVKSFELASDQPWEPRKALNVYGPARLPIRFEPAKRSAGFVRH
jgi:cytochrome P450